MIPLAFVIAVALATLAVLVVAALSLMRQARRMAEAVSRFRNEVEPILQEIRRDTERASDRLERLQREGGTRGSTSGAARVVPVDPDGPSGV